MADETDRTGALPRWCGHCVQGPAQGPPLAELIVEVGPALHGALVEGAVGSGFTLAAGEPPDTTATIAVGAGRVQRLELVGGRDLWEPDSRIDVSPDWRASAVSRAAAGRSDRNFKARLSLVCDIGLQRARRKIFQRLTVATPRSTG
ncbi:MULTISPECIES: hypothetical protein [unclassified Kitasatospora]|uniref:hypothetical protein n=1 Tax=unclassified Kitasatospora TaxID=2633591 RepID=UPI0033FA515B